jgi:hypothetical protein
MLVPRHAGVLSTLADLLALEHTPTAKAHEVEQIQIQETQNQDSNIVSQLGAKLAGVNPTVPDMRTFFTETQTQDEQRQQLYVRALMVSPGYPLATVGLARILAGKKDIAAARDALRYACVMCLLCVCAVCVCVWMWMLGLCEML